MQKWCKRKKKKKIDPLHLSHISSLALTGLLFIARFLFHLLYLSLDFGSWDLFSGFTQARFLLWDPLLACLHLGPVFVHLTLVFVFCILLYLLRYVSLDRLTIEPYCWNGKKNHMECYGQHWQTAAQDAQTYWSQAATVSRLQVLFSVIKGGKSSVMQRNNTP